MDTRQTRRSTRVHSTQKPEKVPASTKNPKSRTKRKETQGETEKNEIEDEVKELEKTEESAVKPKKKFVNPDTFNKNLFNEPYRTVSSADRLVNEMQDFLKSLNADESDEERQGLASQALEKQKSLLHSLNQLEDKKIALVSDKDNKAKKKEKEMQKGSYKNSLQKLFSEEKRKSEVPKVDSETLDKLMKDLEANVDAPCKVTDIVNNSALFDETEKGKDTTTMKRRITEIVKDSQYNQQKASFRFLKNNPAFDSTEIELLSLPTLPTSLVPTQLPNDFVVQLESCLDESNRLASFHLGQVLTQLAGTDTDMGIDSVMKVTLAYFYNLSGIADKRLALKPIKKMNMLNRIVPDSSLDPHLELPTNLIHLLHFLSQLMLLRKLDSQVDFLLIVCQQCLLMLMDFRFTPLANHLTQTLVVSFYTCLKLDTQHIHNLFAILAQYFTLTPNFKTKNKDKDPSEALKNLVRAQILLVGKLPAQRFVYPDGTQSRALIEFKSQLANHFLKQLVLATPNPTNLQPQPKVQMPSQVEVKLHLTESSDVPYPHFHLLFQALLPGIPFPLTLLEPGTRIKPSSKVVAPGVPPPQRPTNHPKGPLAEEGRRKAFEMESLYRRSNLSVNRFSLSWILYKVQLIDIVLDPSLFLVEHCTRVKLFGKLLQYVHDRIIDTKAANLERTEIKEHLQLLYLRLNYFVQAYQKFLIKS